MLKLRRASDLRPLTLNPKSALGSGGEGSVFSTGNRLAAKIYRKPSQAVQQKLTAMLARNSEKLLLHQDGSIAWPVDLLLDESNQIVGFLMPQAVDARPIVDYYNPKARLSFSPLFSYRSLHRTARNLAAAVENLHRQGYVIGDLNESNILVTQMAQVTLVDADSIQVIDGETVYRCRVGKAEFMAPELQGKNLSEVTRTAEQDNFALAILIFQTLMEGSHPFAGVYTGEGEPPTLAARIAVSHFPYGNQSVPYHPSPLALPFTILHPKLQEYFQCCFVDSQENPLIRPNANQWCEALKLAEEELSICKVNTRHIFGSHLNDCPWCYRKKLLSGRDPFPHRNWCEPILKKLNLSKILLFSEDLKKPQKATLIIVCIYLSAVAIFSYFWLSQQAKPISFPPISTVSQTQQSSYPIIASSGPIVAVGSPDQNMPISTNRRERTPSSNPYPFIPVTLNKKSRKITHSPNLIGVINVSKLQVSFCENGNWLSLAESSKSNILRDFKIDCQLPALGLSQNTLGFVLQNRYLFDFRNDTDNTVIFSLKPKRNSFIPRSSLRTALSGNALSPNGLYFASIFDGIDTVIPSNIFVFEGGSNKVLKQIENIEGENNGEAPFSALTFSPDSKMLAVGQYYSFVRIYNVDSGALVSKIQISGLINNIKFISNGSILRISDPSISGYRLVRVSTGQTIKVVGERKPGRSSIAFSSDDKLAAIITQEGARISIYDTLSGRTLKTFASCNEPFDLLVFSKDNKKFAVKDTANNVRVYDLKL